MLRILVITNTTRDDINKIIAYAQQREHWFNVRDRSEGWLDRLPGHNPNLRYAIERGYGCVFSFSHDTEKGILYRHLSISVPGGAYPSPEAVLEIGRLFGFVGKTTDDARVFPDEWFITVDRGEGPINDRCITVMQPADITPT